MSRLVWLIVGLAACLPHASNVCSDGTVCPTDRVCTAGGCALPEQLAACEGLADGTSCNFDASAGQCHDGACIVEFCGDRFITAPEECEGADLGGQTCKSLGFYDDSDALACTPHCTFDVSRCTGFCGDGAVNGPELCESTPGPDQACAGFGYDTGRLTCTHTCTFGFEGCGFLGWHALAVPAPNTLEAVWGSSPTDVFAVGLGGTILHDDGNGFVAMTSNTTDDLFGVWGSGPSDVFAAGGETVLHYDGIAWTQMTLPSTGHVVELSAIWGSGPSDVWTGGLTLFHYDGTQWTVMNDDGQRFAAIWGTGPDNVYFVDNIQLFNGTVWHWDGATLGGGGVGGPQKLKAIWGSGPNDIFVVGSDQYDTIFHFDGTAWTESLQLPTSPRRLLDAIWGSGPNDVFAVGALGMVHWDGTAWSPFPFQSQDQLLAVTGFSPTNVIAVGRGLGGSGSAYAYAGTALTAMVSGTTTRLAAVTGTSAQDAYATIEDLSFRPKLLHTSDGVTWSTVDPGVGLPANFPIGVWEASDGEVFVVGNSRSVLHLDASGTWLLEPTNVTQQLEAVWGTGPSDVFAVGMNGAIIHFDGTTWAPMTIATTDALFGVWGTAGDDVYAVGGSFTAAAGSIYHYDGTTWTQVTTAPQRLASVAGSGPSDIYAVGLAGTVMHFDGSTWSAMDAQTQRDLRAVWARGPHDAFAAGQGGVLLHLDAQGWVPIRSGTTFTLSGAFGTGESLFLVGDGGTTLQLIQTAPVQ